MAININSESFCRKAYLNYHCYGNTMGLSSEDMGKITQAWADRLSSWQATVSSDENEYDFDDSEYARFKANGEAEAKKVSGHDGKTGGQVTRGVVDGVVGIGGAGWNVATGGHSALSNMKNIIKFGGGTPTKGAEKFLTEKTTEVAAEKGAEATAKTTTKSAPKLSTYVQAVMAIAVAAMYMAKKPNKEGKEACDALQNEMGSAQMLLSDTQAEMDTMSDEIMSLSDEANMLNEDANEEIEDQKTEFDMYMQTFLAIQEKIDAGEPLTDSEKQLYKEVMGYMAEISTFIEDTSSDTTDEVADLYDEMGSYQEGYDVAAESMGEVEGLTDFAESFDETTQTMCYIEGAGQAANAISGAMAGAKLMATGFWNWFLGAASIAAGIKSGFASLEQFDWAGQVGTEIAMREATQDLNNETMDIFDEEIDGFDGFMQGVEDLELEIPDEITPPEGTGDPNGVESTEYTDYTEIIEEMKESSQVVTENNEPTGAVMLAPQYGTAIATVLGLPDSTSGGSFGQESIPAIIAQLVPGFSPEDILKVMNGGSLETSYGASIIQTPTGEDTGEDVTVNNSAKSTENLKAVINFYKPIFVKASQLGWKC